jgi:RimJ/RimL family protein N-acetyltransferase
MFLMSHLNQTAIPVIETARTIVRGFRLSDFDAHAAMWADPAVTRFTAGRKPLVREEAWARYLRYAGLWAVLGYGFWAVEEKTTAGLSAAPASMIYAAISSLRSRACRSWLGADFRSTW